MKTLWFDAGRERCFLIPDVEDLAAGDLEIHTSIGRRKQVDEAALSVFEVSREEATEWSRESLRGILGRGGGSGRDGSTASELPVFSALSGESSQDLHGDPEALKRGLREVGARIGEVLQGAMSASAEDRRQAEEKLDELRRVVAEAEAAEGRTADGTEAGGGEGGGGKAGAGEGGGDDGGRRQAEKALRSFADLAGTLGRAAERAGERFGAAADDLRRQRQAATRTATGGPESDDEVAMAGDEPDSAPADGAAPPSAPSEDREG